MWAPILMSAVFFGIILTILYVTFKTKRQDFEEYAVGGRSFGSLYIGMSYVQSWFPGAMFVAFFGLSAGVGAIGWYCLAYSLLGLMVMYFMANRAWRWGHKYGLRSQPDLMGKRFDSQTVRVIAAVIGVASLFPWAILGAQAMGLFVEMATRGAITKELALVIGILIIVIRQYWTVRMGMRGLVYTDMFQGIVSYGAASVAIIIVLATFEPASYGNIKNLPLDFLRIPGDGMGGGNEYGPLYMFSLVAMGTIGALGWPTSFQRIYTAKGVRSVKLGAVWAILIAGVFYVFLTLLAMAGSQMPEVIENPQLGWFNIMELFGGVGMLGLACVCVLGAQMGHTDGLVQVCGVEIANDIVDRPKKPLSSHRLTVVAKVSMAGYMAAAAIAAYFLFEIPRLQLLAQMSYYGIIQLSVPLFFAIFSKIGNKYSAGISMTVGFTLACILGWFYPDDMEFLGSLTAGMVALFVNIFLYLVLALVIPTPAAEKARVNKLFEETHTVSECGPAARERTIGGVS